MLNVTSLVSRFSRWSNETQAERVVLNPLGKVALSSGDALTEITPLFGNSHRLQEKTIHFNASNQRCRLQQFRRPKSITPSLRYPTAS